MVANGQGEDGLAKGQLKDIIGGGGAVLYLGRGAGYTTLYSSKFAELWRRSACYCL